MTCAAPLHRHGDRPAVITPDGVVSHAELAGRVDALARDLGPARRLVLVECANDLPSLVGYLAALRGGHVALLAPRAAPDQVAGLVADWDPDVVVGADGPVARRAGSAHRLHPELALLLATSGSTGRPRLVRLSAASLDANAAAIGEYLGIRADDRAVASLPMHYCYGLSVINANLRAGAAVILDDRPVTDPGFWATVREHRATSLHGVPHSFALLDRVGFAEMDLPHLRYVTQAGGRLAPEEVRRWARVGERRGWDLYVMYGQTEATARMAYLPPRLAAEHPEAVGVAVPGGCLTVEDPGDDGVGELVYTGPNVMLGYAETAADLAVGRTVHALRTGDLGVRHPDGLIEIRGRRSRFVKPFGVRVDLDRLEAMLAEEGLTAAATGTDDHLVVAVATTSAEVTTRARSTIASRLHLPAHAVTVVAVDDLPRRPNGKVDLPAVARLAVPATPAAPTRRRVLTVREVFARTFPGQALSDEATFVDLGGDSLTFVQVSADIERALGRLPDGWDGLPLRDLTALEAQRPARPGRWWSGRAQIEAVVALRAAAIVLVVGEHTHLWSLLGGAHLLLAVSGWTFARFVVGSGQDGRSRRALPRRILHSAALIAVPSSLWIVFRATTQNDVHYADALLMGSVFHPLVQGYWYVGALVQILLVMAGLFAVPAVRRLDRRHPFGLPVALLGVAELARLLPERADTVVPDLYSTHLVAWLFVLGWVIHRAGTPAQRWTCALLCLALVPSFFGTEVERAAVVAGGLLVLLAVGRVTLPRPVATLASTIATASLGIYLTHFALLPLEAHGVRPAVLLPVSLALGVASWWVVTTALRRVLTELRVRRLASAGAPTTAQLDASPLDEPRIVDDGLAAAR